MPRKEFSPRLKLYGSSDITVLETLIDIETLTAPGKSGQNGKGKAPNLLKGFTAVPEDDPEAEPMAIKIWGRKFRETDDGWTGTVRKFTVYDDDGEPLFTIDKMSVDLGDFLEANAAGTLDELLVGMTVRISLTDEADDYTGSALNEIIRAGDGDDTVDGGDGDGDDCIKGGDGDDTITGGLGADKMKGGDGADTFVYLDVAESPAGEDTRDKIIGFESGVDVIDLSAIDADTSGAEDDAFVFVGDAAFTGTAGELSVVQIGQGRNKVTVVSGDVDGDGLADFEIELRGHVDLVETDFVL